MRNIAYFPVVLLVTLALSFPAASPTRGGEEAPLLVRLVSADEDVRDAARDEWDDLDDEARFRLALPGLSSEDPAIAAFCAGHLDPLRLSLAEIRRRAEILAGRAGDYLLPGGEGEGAILAGLGAPELGALWGAFAKLRIPDPKAYFGEEGEVSCSDTFEQTHRGMLPEHLPALVGLIEADDPTVFRELLWTLSLGSEFTDRYRKDVARAMLYGLARIRAEKEGAPLPNLADFAVDAPASGLPDAFEALATWLWFTGPKQYPLSGALSCWLPDPAWLLRWARDLTPSPKDLPFLLRVARQKDWTLARVWAVGALAGLDALEARSYLKETARGEGFLAPFAAVELARRGNPARLHELLARSEPPAHTIELALSVAPEAAWKAWFATRQEYSLPYDPSDRSLLRADYGISIPEDAFGPFLARELAPEHPPAGVIQWIGVFPDLFPREEIETLVGKVVSGPPPEKGVLLFEEDYLPSLAILQVRAPDQLERLLAWLAGSPDEPTRDETLRLFARIGDGSKVEETLSRLDALLDAGAPDDVQAAADLGGLADERIEAALRARALLPDRAKAWPALLGLCFRHGLDPRVVPVLEWIDPAGFEPGVWTAFHDAALAGDFVGALLALYGSKSAPDEDVLPWLGTSRDPRAIAFFERQRRERTALYWPATGGLALAGDATAKAELAGWVRDARTVMVDDLTELPVVAMEADPDLVDLAIDRLESNCCLGFYETVVLGQRFPTLDSHYEMHDFPETRRRIRAWYERHRGHFAFSRIVRGWVPSD